MIRVDGDFVVYVLKANDHSKPGRDDKWYFPSYDHFGNPKGFTASGDCWQKLGIFGTFDRNEAIAGMNEMHGKYPQMSWKVCELKISQHHRDVCAVFGDS